MNMKDCAKSLLRLERPSGPVDVVLDTDTYNEIDDQFALAYLIRSEDRLHLKAIYAAPFSNEKSSGPEDGMEKSHAEILNILGLMDREDLAAAVFKGSRRYLPSETEAVPSEAASDLVTRSKLYSREHPLYVIAIGAVTNVASALLIDPTLQDRIVLIWLGGHSLDWPDTREFNMMQDVAAARVVFGCGVPLVQLPCMGVVSAFTTSGPELVHHLGGRNRLCDYLVQTVTAEARRCQGGPAWTRAIWDVTAVAWLLGGFTRDRLIPSPIPQYDHHYSFDPGRHFIRYVYHIERDRLFADLFEKLAR